jgi:hypothetical protein
MQTIIVACIAAEKYAFEKCLSFFLTPFNNKPPNKIPIQYLPFSSETTQFKIADFCVSKLI